LANRVDRGFNVELRVSPVRENIEEDKEPTEQEVAVNQIIESAKKIEYSNTPGEPVLFLPENNRKQ